MSMDIEALAQRFDPIEIRVKDRLERMTGYLGSRASVATADGWRALQEKIEWDGRYFVGRVMVGDIVRQTIRWQRPYWRHWVELRWYVVGEDGRLIAVLGSMAGRYLKRRRAFLQKKGKGEWKGWAMNCAVCGRSVVSDFFGKPIHEGGTSLIGRCSYCDRTFDIETWQIGSECERCLRGRLRLDHRVAPQDSE